MQARFEVDWTALSDDILARICMYVPSLQLGVVAVASRGLERVSHDALLWEPRCRAVWGNECRLPPPAMDTLLAGRHWQRSKSPSQPTRRQPAHARAPAACSGPCAPPPVHYL